MEERVVVDDEIGIAPDAECLSVGKGASLATEMNYRSWAIPHGYFGSTHGAIRTGLTMESWWPTPIDTKVADGGTTAGRA